MAKGKVKRRKPVPDKPMVTLAATVEKIIPPAYPGDTEKMEVSIEEAEPLYREIRVENKVKTASGEDVKLEPGAEVEVTIEADSDAPTHKDTAPNTHH